MKYTILLFALFLTISLSFAQTSLIDNSRYIKVSGSAKIEITPNKIIIAAYLKERIERKEKVDLSRIEKQFNEIIQQLGIAKEKISFDKAEGRYTQIRRRQSDVLASKVILVEFSDGTLANDFLDALKDADIANDIRKKTHTELPRFRKETKIEALKAVRGKAEYLIEAADANIGKVLRVTESDDSGLRGINYTSRSARTSNISSNSGMFSTESVGQWFSPIKIRYVMDVIYEIVD